MPDEQLTGDSELFSTDFQQVFAVLQSGHTVEIITPTGKELDVYYELSEVVIVESTGSTHAGDAARERLKKTLRSKGTEWSLKQRVNNDWH
ncbi:hypothetical protein [Salinibaculum rarum]|uniref:hypothetical protein n=1 Tax=Salinibaculum rarum TaxID=3058903 RepID=UPI00265FF0BF|nr:hypothetical protein [Salinibaculum sp. KK48]